MLLVVGLCEGVTWTRWRMRLEISCRTTASLLLQTWPRLTTCQEILSARCLFSYCSAVTRHDLRILVGLITGHADQSAPNSDQSQIRPSLPAMPGIGRDISTFPWQLQCNHENSVRATRLICHGLQLPRSTSVVFSLELCKGL